MSGWGMGGASEQQAGSSLPVTLTSLYPVHGHVTLNGGSSLSVWLSKLGQAIFAQSVVSCPKSGMN
jgi:hypothetical protein